jgi:hypothetical protein
MTLYATLIVVAILGAAAAIADAFTPLGLLNFCVLQWFGVRLARRFRVEQYDVRSTYLTMVPGGGFSLGGSAKTRRVPDGYTLQRWSWPLTGWWTDFRWIARRS